MALLGTAGHDRPPTKKNRRRRWSIAPAPAISSAHFEGFQQFAELPREIGLVLFRWIRAIRLWADTERSARDGLFREGGAPNLIPEWARNPGEFVLQTCAGVMSTLVSAPAAVEPAVVSQVCTEVSAW